MFPGKKIYKRIYKEDIMTVNTERKPPKMMGMLKVWSMPDDVNAPIFELPLQKFYMESGDLVVVAHRHTNQQNWINLKLQSQAKDELFCFIETETQGFTYKVEFEGCLEVKLKEGTYPVARFKILSEVSKGYAENDFSVYNQDQTEN
jgi:hypothetical protein